jgi:hypothetical protein
MQSFSFFSFSPFVRGLPFILLSVRLFKKKETRREEGGELHHLANYPEREGNRACHTLDTLNAVD